MRGRGRRQKHVLAQTRIPGEPTSAREAVETAWFSRMTRESKLAEWVTAKGARAEPFHRWLVFKQAFSPELVRQVLADIDETGATSTAPILDPFAGTGTTIVEFARHHRAAIGIDPSRALKRVTDAKATRCVSDLPDLPDEGDATTVAGYLSDPIHQAALLCAEFSRYTAKGKLNVNAPSLTDALHRVLSIMRDDIRRPLPIANRMELGDGRSLTMIDDQSIGGIITSPPYLSRHDYARILEPIEVLSRFWNNAGGDSCPAPRLPAHPRATARLGDRPFPAAVSEAVGVFESLGHQRLGTVVREYFQGLFDGLAEWRRILRPDARCGVVIGGARLKDVYVPTDTLFAEAAQGLGFRVERVMVARNLIPGGRNFGRLRNVAPRESVIFLRRC